MAKQESDPAKYDNKVIGACTTFIFSKAMPASIPQMLEAPEHDEPGRRWTSSGIGQMISNCWKITPSLCL
jgi:hypothetical protein